MDLVKKIITSSSLLIGIKAFHRLIGLISILLLARLLTPVDFAIVALTSIVVHFFDILSSVGSEQYIIQKNDVSKQDLNTAWTIDILLKSTLWLLLILFSQFISIFFEQPQLEYALYASSFILIINALKNPGLFLLKQNFEYKNIFWLSIIQKTISFAVVIIIAFKYRSFWALIIADIVSSLVFTLGSYSIHQHRPQLTLLKGKQQWNFSKWLLFKGVVGYMRSQIDTLIVSKFFSAIQLGHYYLARDIAMMPSHNLLLPAIEPLLAAFRTTRNNMDKLGFQVRLSLFIVALVSFPISAFIWYFPEPIINTLLGNQWTGAYDLLSVLALLFFYFSFVQVLEQLLLAIQKVRALFYYDAISLLLISAILLLLISDSLVEFGFIRGLLGLLTMSGLLMYSSMKIKLELFRLLAMCIPITISTTGAVIATQAWGHFWEDSVYVLFDLLLKLLIFCLTYMITTTILLMISPQKVMEFTVIKLFIRNHLLKKYF